MHKILIKLVVLSTLILTVSACNKTDSNKYISKKDFLVEINEKMAIDGEDYLTNLKDFMVISNNENLDNINDFVTNNFALNIMSNISDVNPTELGIEILDNEQLIDKNIALQLISETIKYANNVEFETNVDGIEVIDDIDITNDYSDTFNPKKTFISTEKFEIDDLIMEDNQYYKVVSITDLEDEYSYELEEANINDILEGVDIDTSFDVDLSGAEIELAEESSSTESNLQLLSSNFMRKQLTIKGYDVYYSVSGSGFRISVSKQTSKGLRFFGEYDLNNLKANFKWNYHRGMINDAYLRFDYNTDQAIGVKANKYYDRFLDVKSLKNIDSFYKLQSTFKTKQDLIEDSFDVMTFKVPIPSCPTFTMKLKLQLHVYLSGRVELTLNTVNKSGFEVKNNHLRVINESDKDLDFIIKANAALTLGLNFGIYCFNVAIADSSIESGVKSYVAVTSHLYEDNNHEISEDDFSYDVAEYVSEDNSDFLVCGDLSLYYTTSLKFNTSATLLSKLNLSKNIVLNDDNNQILKNKMTHIENGQFVEKCTRGDRVVSNLTPEITNTDQIQLEKYAIVLRESEQEYIVVSGLPNEYSLNDLILVSNNNEVATISGFTVVANNKGATEVIVKTSDNKFSASVTILVMSKK